MAQQILSAFSWEKFSSILDMKLKDVAKKEDLAPLVAEIIELKAENQKLKNDIITSTTRLEQIDRKTRSANIIVNGIKNKNVNEAKTDFTQLCSKVLGVNVNVVTARTLPNEHTFLFNLESNMQVFNALAVKGKLKGKGIFIQKDYTKEEQNVRYNLRTLNKNISKLKKNLKIRMGEFSIYIDNKKYSWSMGSIVAYSNADADYLRNLLEHSSYSVDIIVRDGYPAANYSSNLPPI